MNTMLVNRPSGLGFNFQRENIILRTKLHSHPLCASVSKLKLLMTRDSLYGCTRRKRENYTKDGLVICGVSH
jgi:hypothetical protein